MLSPPKNKKKRDVQSRFSAKNEKKRDRPIALFPSG